MIFPTCQMTFPVSISLLDWNRKPRLDQTQHIPIDDSPGDTLHEFAVWNGVKGNHHTLPTISTSPNA